MGNAKAYSGHVALINRSESIFKPQPRADAPVVGPVAADTDQTVHIYPDVFFDGLADLKFHRCGYSIIFPIKRQPGIQFTPEFIRESLQDDQVKRGRIDILPIERPKLLCQRNQGCTLPRDERHTKKRSNLICSRTNTLVLVVKIQNPSTLRQAPNDTLNCPISPL